MKTQHDRLIMIDLDHTLFNTTMFVDELAAFFQEKFGVMPEVFRKEREAVKSCCVVEDVDLFVTRLPHDDKEAMHKAYHDFVERRASEFTFADSVSFIERHADQFDVHLVTHGDEELQGMKIRHSGLPVGLKFVIAQVGKSVVTREYDDAYEKIYFIDDKGSNIDEVKREFPDVVAYFIKRPEDSPYAHDEPMEANGDFEVSDLSFTIS